MYKELIEDRIGKRRIATGVERDATLGMLNAALKTYPLIVLANLSANSYVIVRNDDFLDADFPESGKFDDMIDNGLDYVHDHYQRVFFGCFSRENLLARYERGQEEVYAEVYHRVRDGSYRWISITAIRLNDDDNDDIMHVCFCRELPEQTERPFGRK